LSVDVRHWRIGPRSASGRILATGQGTRFAGDGGPATSAELTGPLRVVVDSHGNVLMTDGGRVRVVAAAAQFLAERGMESEPPGFGDGEIFEFRVGRCLLTRTDGHGDWSPKHSVWAAR
jgi:hypothetical protein